MRFTIPTRTNKAKSNSFVSKIVASVFLLPFGIMGVFVAIMLVLSLIKKEAEWYLAFFLLIPLVFMVVGFGGTYMIWFGKEKVKTKTLKAKSSKMSKKAGVIVGLIFVAAGLGFTYGFLIRPFIKIQQAKSWIETPCTITSAKVGSHRGDESTTYSIDITYEYEFSGQTYHADRYEFIGGSSSGRRRKQEVVDRYQKMSEPVCYVNPEKPSEAVLQRKWTSNNWFGFFPLIFVAAGAAVVIGVLRHKKRKGMEWLPVSPSADSESAKTEYGFAQEAIHSSDEPVTLKPNTSPLGKLVGVLFFCLIWNGFIWGIIFFVSRENQTPILKFALSFPLIIFVLVGLGISILVIYQMLALFNPRYTLILQPGELFPGTAGVIGWQCRGKASRIQHLSMTLTGQENATYRVGTNTRTAENTFFEMQLVDNRDLSEIKTGQIGFAIPANTMHSFEASNNKIIWSMNIHADIARWPDVKHSYKIIVSPNPIEKDL